MNVPPGGWGRRVQLTATVKWLKVCGGLKHRRDKNDKKCCKE